MVNVVCALCLLTCEKYEIIKAPKAHLLCSSVVQCHKSLGILLAY